MINLQLQGPDGACRQAAGSFGRSDFSPEDATISRRQFSLEPVEDALILQNHGTNGVSA